MGDFERANGAPLGKMRARACGSEGIAEMKDVAIGYKDGVNSVSREDGGVFPEGVNETEAGYGPYWETQY